MAKVRDDDLELLLSHVGGEATSEANDAWCGNDGPDARLVAVLWACKRVRKSLKLSVAGKRAYATAKARGNLPPVLTRVSGMSLMDGRVVDGDHGQTIYIFERRAA
jgi:hypothetical protein